MAATVEQLRIAATIDSKMQALLDAGCNDAIILGEMFDHMPGLKLLLDSGQPVLDELCERFPSFYRFAKILENVSDEDRRKLRETLEGMRGEGLASKDSERRTVPCGECGDWRGMVPSYKCPKCSTGVTFSVNDLYQYSKLHVRCPSCQTIVHIPQSLLCTKCGKGLADGWDEKILVTGTPAYKDETDPYLGGMRDLARKLKARHGPVKSLSCCSGFSDFKMILQFDDGTKLESGARTGKIDIHRMAFGYYGTGPSCLERFLKEFGITISDDQIERLRPGSVVDFDRVGSFSVRTDDRIVEKS
jgi:hypothetical protein